METSGCLIKGFFSPTRGKSLSKYNRAFKAKEADSGKSTEESNCPMLRGTEKKLWSHRDPFKMNENQIINREKKKKSKIWKQYLKYIRNL